MAYERSYTLDPDGWAQHAVATATNVNLHVTKGRVTFDDYFPIKRAKREQSADEMRSRLLAQFRTKKA